MRRPKPTRVVTVLLPLLSAACGVFASSEEGPAQASELVSWVERVYVESEAARQRVQAAMTALQALSAGTFQGGAIAAYRAFNDEIQRCEDQAARLAATVAPMKQVADGLFERWNRDLGEMQSADLRRRSEARLRGTQQRYQGVVAVVDPAQTALQAFTRTLKDHSLFLGNDLNAGAIGDLRGDVQNLARAAADLDARLQRAQGSSLTYVQAAGILPAAAPAATPAAPGAR